MRTVLPILLLIAALAGIWWINQERQPPSPAPTAEGVALPELRPEPRYPLPQPEPEPELDPEPLTLLLPPAETEDAAVEADPAPVAAEPLPALADSDPLALSSLGAMLGAEAAARWVRPEWIISRTVVIMHSMDGPAPPIEMRPLSLLPGVPQTANLGEDQIYWTETTARRYAELVALLGAVSPTEASAIYARHYPLFQAAWEELGEAEPWFNDRLIDVIDHLLGAPRVELPIELLPWEGRLKFAAEELEAESWGRKLLVRLGPQQAALVHEWLREFRAELTARAD